MQSIFKTVDGWDRTRKTVEYNRDDEYHKQVMGDETEQWWHDFAEKWPETEILGFADVEYTPEQLARLEEIQEVEGQYQKEVERYVLDGIVPNIPFFMPTLEEMQAQTLLNTEFLVVLAEITQV